MRFIVLCISVCCLQKMIYTSSSLSSFDRYVGAVVKHDNQMKIMKNKREYREYLIHIADQGIESLKERIDDLYATLKKSEELQNLVKEELKKY